MSTNNALNNSLLHCTGLPIGGITASGSPSSSNFLRGDSTWAVPSASGGLINVQYLTSSSGTYTKTSGTNSCIVLAIAAGGGGAGAGDSGVSDNAAGGGGGGGAAGMKRYTMAPATAPYTIGQGGAGGVGTSGSSGNGGNTTFNTNDIKMGGGVGGESINGNGPAFSPVVAGGVALSGDTSDVVWPGQSGNYGLTLGSDQPVGGNGGSAGNGSAGGIGGYSTSASTAGGNAAGFGGGGGGAMSFGTASPAALAGGSGANGIIIVWEYS